MRKLMVAMVLITALGAAPAGALAPHTPDPGAWVPDGTVYSVIRAGGSTWVGGSFDWWGPWTGSAAGADVVTGATDPAFPIVSGGVVLAATPDGIGGAYIGGNFSAVDGQPRAGLAHLNSGGTLDPSFTPVPNGDVDSLALAPNSANLYVGGRFTTIDGQTHKGIGAVAPIGDTVRAWNACADYFDPYPGEDSEVDAIAVSADSATVYAGGKFDEVGTTSNCGSGAPSYLAAFNASTGAPTAWNPKAGGDVHALALTGGTLYAGGNFSTVGANQVTRPAFAALSTATGNASAFAPAPDGQVRSIVVSGSTIYAGGGFSTIGTNAAHRVGVAALTTAGAATSFDAHLGNDPIKGYVWVNSLALSTSPARLVAGGLLATASGKAEIASLDATTGAVDEAFDPRPGGEVHAVTATAAGHVFFGGQFNSVGVLRRSGIAQLDAFGHPTSFTLGAPVASLSGMVLSPDGSAIYAYGYFGGGQWPDGRAFSTTNGADLGWTPTVTGGYINTIAVSPDGGTVYLGGSFSSVDGAPRTGLGAVSATGAGNVLSWRPDADGAINALALSTDGSTVYAGGQFGQIGTSVATRHNLAALSATTADVMPWAPNPDGSVGALTLGPDHAHIYVGGQFTHIGTTPSARTGIADLTTSTGNATPFHGDVDDYGPSSIAVPADESVVYAAGYYRKAFTFDRWGIDAFDGATGSELFWTPGLDHFNHTTTVAVSDDTAYLGSSSFGYTPGTRPYYSQFSTAPANATPPALGAAPVRGIAVACSPGSWRNGPDIGVQWLLDGSPVAGGTSRSYTPAAGDIGHQIACREDAANPAGTASATSASAVVAEPPAAAPGSGIPGSDTSGGQPGPAGPGSKLTLGLKLRAKHPRARRALGLVLTVSAPVHVTCTLSRPAKRGKATTVGKARWNIKAGRSTASLAAGRRAKAGRYQVVCRASGASGSRASAKLAVRLRR